MERKLYRSRRERMIAGVCGGIAEYYGVDPTLVRLITVVLTLVSFGTAVIAYIVLMIVVPEETDVGASEEGAPMARTPAPPPPPGTPQGPAPPGAPTPQWSAAPPAGATARPPEHRRRGGITFGIVLVVLGIVLLMSQFIPGFEIWRLWPLIIVAIGVRTMFRRDDD